jgi:hypothetical protein
VPAPSPGLFGRFGTARTLEKEVRQAEKFQSAVENAEAALKHMHSEGAKSSAELKKRHAEVKAAVEMVSQALKGTTKSAAEYGRAVEKDSRAVLDFAQKHKISLNQAVDMYKKVQGEQSKIGQFFNRWKGWAGVAATAGAAMKEYHKRVEEVRTAHQLLLSDVALSTSKSGDAFKDTQKYIDGYREAIRSAHDMTSKWGVSADEARQTTQTLAFSLRGQIKDISKLGQVLKEDTDRIYGFSKAMNVDAATAIQFFRNEMRVQGRTHEEARKSMDTMIAGYDQLRLKVDAASAPLKEEYLATLMQIRQEMGPTQVSTGAMTAAMNMLAESAKKAGLSAQGVTDTMAAAPKLLKGLPRFYKMEIGGSILHAMRTNSDEFKKLAQEQPKVAKQLQALAKTDMPVWRKQEIAQQLTEGTSLGMSGVLKKLKQVGPALRSNMYQNMGLTAEQIVAIESGLKTGTLSAKKLSEMTTKVQKGQKDATKTRESMADNLTKNTKGLDRVAIEANKMEHQIRSLIDQYSTYVTPALGALTLAMNASNLVSSLKGLGGGIGGAAGSLGQLSGAAGKAGAAGALIGVGVAAYQFGTWLDKKFGISDKISDWAFKQDKEILSKMERLKRSGGHAEQTYKAGEEYLKRFEAMRKAGVTKIQERYSTKGLKPGEKGYLASERVREVALTAETMRKHLKKSLGLEAEVKAGRMTEKQAEAIMKGMEKRIAQIEKIKPPAKKTEEAKKEGEKQRAKAEHRAKVGEAALKSTSPQGRAQVAPEAVKPAEQSQAGGSLQDMLMGATPTGPPQSRFDPAMNQYTVKSVVETTISGNDPNYQNFQQQNQSNFNPKRGR